MGVSLKDILAERGDQVYLTSRSNHKDDRNIHYIKGDAHDDAFMTEILKDGYDADVYKRQVQIRGFVRHISIQRNI